MTQLQISLRYTRVLFASIAFATITAGAQGSPIQFTVTDLGNQVAGSGLDNNGDTIAAPVRNIVGSIAPGVHLPFSDGYSTPAVIDGMGDGRLLVELFRNRDSQTYIYWPRGPIGDHSPIFENVFSAIGSFPVDMNANGEVIGGIRTDGGTRLLLRSASGIQDLNESIPADSGWRLLALYSINDRSQILCWGINSERRTAVLLLTPEGEEVHIPEPGAWMVFGLAAAAFAWRRRRAG